MKISTSVLKIFAAGCVSLLALFAGPAQGQYTSVLDYLPAPGSIPPCIARDPGNPGSFERTVATTCNVPPSGAFTMYLVMKGDETGPMRTWGGETWFLDHDGWIKGLEESGWCDCVSGGCGCGSQTFYRAFRDEASSRKGFRWLPSGFSGWSANYQVGRYHEEYWVDALGRPSCWGVTHTPVLGSVEWGWVYKDALPGFLEDRRPGNTFGQLYDVDVIVQEFYWGNYSETHWYGQFWDPKESKQVALGHVNFEWMQQVPRPRVIQARADRMYLVDNCSPSLPCFTCPDP